MDTFQSMNKNLDIKTLGEVCQFRRGLTYSKSDEVSSSNNAVLRANNINLETNTLNFDDVRYISNNIEIPQNKKLVRNSVMICTASGSRSHLGKVAFIDKDYDYAFGGFMGLLVPDSGVIDPKYFFIILTSGQFRDHINSLTAGANINNLKFSQIQDYPIALPPLSEQKRIVEILDHKFEAIEKLKGVTKAQLADAKELFESQVTNIFINYYHQDNKVSLSELTSLITKGSSPKWQGIKYVKKDDGILFVTSKNVGSGCLLMEDSTFLERRFNDIQKRSVLCKGDVLTNIVGASIGRTAIYHLDEVANINQAVCVIRCNEKLFNKFLVYLLNSKFFVEILHANEVNTARANLSLAFFSNLQIPDISYNQQVEIVRELEKLEEVSSSLDSLYRRKIFDLEELKKSYLEQAFEGKL